MVDVKLTMRAELEPITLVDMLDVVELENGFLKITVSNGHALFINMRDIIMIDLLKRKDNK